VRALRLAVASLVLSAWGCAAAVATSRPAPDSFSALVKRLSPTVVNISTTQAPGGADAQRRGPSAGLDRELRDRIAGGSSQSGGQSLGSGFTIDPSGFIVTNRHVVAGARTIAVTFADGQKLPAMLVGADAKTDLALLKVEPRSPLQAVSFADSDKSDVGDWVVAIGNPYGLGGSVSVGIVSARNRELNLGSYDDFIQTDAAINSGNSGGPLFNLEGEVVGVNSALLSPSGGSVGIGFAISANLARPVIAQLRSFGAARRGWIGVRVQAITADIADSLGLDRPRGALVSNVTGRGPAQQAGLQPGDVILRFDGKDVDAMRSFPRTVAETAPGKRVAVDILRRGKPQTLSLLVQQLTEPSEPVLAAPVPIRAPPRGLGLQLAPLSPELRQRFAVPEGVAGAVVTAVDAAGTAADHDVKPGDVVVKAGTQSVARAEDVDAQLAAARAAKRRFLLVGVSRRGETSFKAIKVPGG
jgi:serine protease Do